MDHLKSDGVVVLVSGCPERMLVMNEEAVLLRMDLGPYRHQCCFGPPQELLVVRDASVAPGCVIGRLVRLLVALLSMAGDVRVVQSS